MPSPHRRACLVLHHFDSEPALPPPFSILRAGVRLRASSSRRRGFDGAYTQLPCLRRQWCRPVKAQALELLPDNGPSSLLACEHGREHAEPKLQRRDGFFFEG